MADNVPKIHIGEGDICDDCKQPMQRYGKPKDFVAAPGQTWFTHWDYCKPCKKFKYPKYAKRIGM